MTVPSGPAPSKAAVVRGSWLVTATAAEVTEPTTFRLDDREWDLLPGVFSPDYCVSTGFFTESLPFPAGGSFLEVGCGAGVTAVRAVEAGCTRVAATDISRVALENTALNAVRHGVSDRVELYCGDVFDGLGPEDRFDLVFWNSPFIDPGFIGSEDSGDPGDPGPAGGAGAGPARTAPRDLLRRAVFDPGYRAHQRYFAGARHRLAPGGRLLLGFSSLGDHEALHQLAADTGHRIAVLRSSGGLARGVDYQLLDITPDDDQFQTRR